MEFGLESAKLDACAKQLNACEKILAKRVNEIQEIVEKLRRMESTEAAGILNSRLKMQSEEIRLQCRKIDELQKVLSKILRMYQKYEDEILQTNEAQTHQYDEKPRIVHLKKNEEFQILLK